LQAVVVAELVQAVVVEQAERAAQLQQQAVVDHLNQPLVLPLEILTQLQLAQAVMAELQVQVV
jgi:hypothetical protein